MLIGSIGIVGYHARAAYKTPVGRVGNAFAAHRSSSARLAGLYRISAFPVLPFGGFGDDPTFLSWVPLRKPRTEWTGVWNEPEPLKSQTESSWSGEEGASVIQLRTDPILAPQSPVCA
jgi:hypothetical protein